MFTLLRRPYHGLPNVRGCNERETFRPEVEDVMYAATHWPEHRLSQTKMTILSLQ